METINSNTENTKDSVKPTENINFMDDLGLYNGRSLHQAQKAIQDVKNLIEYLGDDPNREGLRETPKRVILSYDHLFSGYGQRVEDVLKVFEDDTSDQMILLKEIEFYSTCEHHMLPFFGKAHIAYIPNGKVVGISKLARILEIFSRRLQIQERLAQNVTEALMTHLNPLGAACLLEAQHFCMTSRGVQKQNSVMVTSSLEGVFRENASVKTEFLALIKG
jgi:GTP cyclohydrolase I